MRPDGLGNGGGSSIVKERTTPAHFIVTDAADVGQLTALRDPLREKLVELAKGHGVEVPAV